MTLLSLRLSPIIPFSALNYLAGTLSVSFRDYLLSMFAIIPGTVLYVFLGASAGSLADSAGSGSSNTTVTIVVVVVGIVLGVLAIYLTTRYARKELQRIIEERQNVEGETTGSLDVVDTTAVSVQNKDSDDVVDIEAPPPEKDSDDGNSTNEGNSNIELAH
jgi:membrane protein implicated in regulation of membrane protease activity